MDNKKQGFTSDDVKPYFLSSIQKKMKNIFIICLFLIPQIFIAQGTNNIASENFTKEDLIDCFNKVLSFERLAPYLDQQIQHFGEIIFKKRQGDQNIWSTIQNEDFYDSAYRVAILDKFELENRDLEMRRLMNWRFQFRSGRILVYLSA